LPAKALCQAMHLALSECFRGQARSYRFRVGPEGWV